MPRGLVVKNDSKIRGAASGAMPGPLSLTSTTTWSPSSKLRTRTRLRLTSASSSACTAFEIRFRNTCPSRGALASTSRVARRSCSTRARYLSSLRSIVSADSTAVLTLIGTLTSSSACENDPRSRTMRWMRAIPSFDSCRIALASNSRFDSDPRAASRSGQLAQLVLDEAHVPGQRFDVRQHERGRVVDLVRDAGGEHPDRRQLLRLQAPDLPFAFVGRVADVEDDAALRQRIGAHHEGTAVERQAAIRDRAAAGRLAGDALQLRLQHAAKQALADGVGDLERSVPGQQADAVLEHVERLAQHVRRSMTGAMRATPRRLAGDMSTNG